MRILYEIVTPELLKLYNVEVTDNPALNCIRLRDVIMSNPEEVKIFYGRYDSYPIFYSYEELLFLKVNITELATNERWFVDNIKSLPSSEIIKTLSLTNRLGEGMYGIVFDLNKNYVIKVNKKRGNNEDILSVMMAMTMSRVSKTFVEIKGLGKTTSGSLILIMGKCSGDYERYLRHFNGKTIDEINMLNINFKKFLDALVIINDFGYCHSDIKLDNLCADGTIIDIDAVCSCTLKGVESTLSSTGINVDDLNWKRPEIRTESSAFKRLQKDADKLHSLPKGALEMNLLEKDQAARHGPLFSIRSNKCFKFIDDENAIDLINLLDAYVKAVEILDPYNNFQIQNKILEILGGQNIFEIKMFYDSRNRLVKYHDLYSGLLELFLTFYSS